MQDLLVEKSYDWKTQSFHDCVRYNLGFYSFHEKFETRVKFKSRVNFEPTLTFLACFFLSVKMMHQGYKNAHF